MVLVELEDLTLGYNGQAVVTDVNLKLRRGILFVWWDRMGLESQL